MCSALGVPSERLGIERGVPRVETVALHHRGNTEGTPTGAPASTRGHLSSDVSFVLRGFRARGFPPLPARPDWSLDGKEGVDGSSPSEGSRSRSGDRCWDALATLRSVPSASSKYVRTPSTGSSRTASGFPASAAPPVTGAP